MRLRRPPPLERGDRVGIVAPAGPVRADLLDRGLSYLEARGYVPVPGDHLRDRRAYLGGSDADRLRDLHRMLGDASIRAVWFARGGYGSGRIVGGVDFGLLRRDPKPLVGYSDATVLLAAAQRRAGLSGCHAPMVSQLGDPAAFDEASLWLALEGAAEYALPLAPGRVLRPGVASAPLVGGCLAVLVGLVGTPFEPETDGAILFWEDVNEEPFRIDRMLGHLRLAGILARLRGMVVGRLIGCEPVDPANRQSLEEILEFHLAGTDYPVVVDFPAGHCPGNVTLPLGRRARLDTAAGTLSILNA